MIEVRDARAEQWADVVTVMGSRGDPARCFCQFFRMPVKQWQAGPREKLRDALREQVCDDPLPPGVVAYSEGEPVGWCAVSPRATYSRLGEIGNTLPDADGLWSVTCFVVRVGHRRQGIGSALLHGAVALAARNGARVVEAYPVDLAAKKASSAELYHGSLSTFLGAGFTEVARPSAHRPIVRRAL